MKLLLRYIGVVDLRIVGNRVDLVRSVYPLHMRIRHRVLLGGDLLLLDRLRFLNRFLLWVLLFRLNPNSERKGTAYQYGDES